MFPLELSNLCTKGPEIYNIAEAQIRTSKYLLCVCQMFLKMIWINLSMKSCLVFYNIAVQVNFCVLQLVYQHLYMFPMFLCCFFSSVCFVVFRCLFLICLFLFYYYSSNACLFYKNRQNGHDSGRERSWGRIQRSCEGKLYHNINKKIYISKERKIDMWWRFWMKKPQYYILK